MSCDTWCYCDSLYVPCKNVTEAKKLLADFKRSMKEEDLWENSYEKFNLTCVKTEDGKGRIEFSWNEEYWPDQLSQELVYMNTWLSEEDHQILGYWIEDDCDGHRHCEIIDGKDDGFDVRAFDGFSLADLKRVYAELREKYDTNKKTYNVGVKSVSYKSYTVEATTEDDAIDKALSASKKDTDLNPERSIWYTCHN